MNIPSRRRRLQRLLAAALCASWLATMAPAAAAPGAHGPDGEHLDAPSPLRAAAALPRVEAHTEAFELVAELRAGELAIVVDRYETNEPVLGARLEVESGALNAVAAFRAEQGDYAVTDAALVKALAAPGEHGLVFTLVAGAESDLLDATLVSTAKGFGDAGAARSPGHAHGDDGHVHAHGDAHDHDLERAALIGAGVLALGLVGGIAWWRQRRRAAGLAQGSL